MRRPSLSIANLMVAVVVIALNIAAARALSSHSLLMLIGTAPIGIFLQIGLFRLICGRDRARMFWAGFVAFGSSAMASFIWGTLTPPVARPGSGRMIFASTPGSAMWALWDRYFQFAVASLMPLPGAHWILGIGGEIPIATMTTISSLPQFLIAAAGGLLVGLIPIRHRRPDRPIAAPDASQ